MPSILLAEVFPSPSDFISLLLHPDFLFVAREISRWILFGEEEEFGETCDNDRMKKEREKKWNHSNASSSEVPSSSPLPPLSVLPPPVQALVLYTALCDTDAASTLYHSLKMGSKTLDVGRTNEHVEVHAEYEEAGKELGNEGYFLSSPSALLSSDEIQAILCLSTTTSVSVAASCYFSSTTGFSIAKCRSLIAALQLSSTQKLCRKVLHHFPKLFSLLVQQLPWSLLDIPWRVDWGDGDENCSTPSPCNHRLSPTERKTEMSRNEQTFPDSCPATCGEESRAASIHTFTELPSRCSQGFNETSEGQHSSPHSMNARSEAYSNTNTRGLPKSALSLLRTAGGVPGFLAHYEYIQQTSPGYEEALKRRERELDRCLIRSLQKAVLTK